MVHPRIVTLCQTHNKSTTTLLCPTATARRRTGGLRVCQPCSWCDTGIVAGGFWNVVMRKPGGGLIKLMLLVVAVG
jgi:hypothetical protein